MAKKILLIDDEKDIVQIMRKKLQTAGYEVSVAYNGKDGLDITGQEHPHLIMTDVVMPVMDGFIFYQELKSREDVRHIPVIVASAHGTTEDAFRAIGVKDFLVKPFDTQHLVNIVNSFFHGARAVNVLMATKMIYLMRSILNDTPDLNRRIDLHLTNDPASVLDESLKLRPELIVLDVDMFLNPSGQETVRALRERPELKETTILLTRSMLGDSSVFSSNREADKAVGDCLARGASHFIGALNKNSFMAIVQEYCRSNATGQK